MKLSKYSIPPLFLAGVLVGATLLGGGAVGASSSKKATVTFCVNKKTSVVTQRKQCLSSEKKLTLNIKGEQGPQGEQGEKGESGQNGSGANLSPALSLLNSRTMQPDECNSIERLANNVLWAEYNFYNQFTGPIQQDVLSGLGENCIDNFMSERYSQVSGDPLFRESPRVEVTLVSNPVYTKTFSKGQFDIYGAYQLNVTSYKVAFSKTTGWHLCSSSDSQWASMNSDKKLENQHFEEQLDGTYVVSQQITKTVPENAPSTSWVFLSSPAPSFCGPDSRTLSGKSIETIYFESKVRASSFGL